MELFRDNTLPGDQPDGKVLSQNRANDLDGRDWTKYSISVWDDIRFTAEERDYKHPAMFPTMLAERLIRCFTKESEKHILDPFMGSGSTLVAARNLCRSGIGFELYETFVSLANRRLTVDLFAGDVPKSTIHKRDSRQMLDVIEPNSIDFVCTSPPYWDILTQKRTADYKAARPYGSNSEDLGLVADYDDFLRQLMEVFAPVLQTLRPGKYCVVNVMDLRKKDCFFPYHMDFAQRMAHLGFIFDDIIIWDRRKDYNNFRALGYPSTFRVNKAHEFLLIFRKPKTQ